MIIHDDAHAKVYFFQKGHQQTCPNRDGTMYTSIRPRLPLNTARSRYKNALLGKLQTIIGSSISFSILCSLINASHAAMRRWAVAPRRVSERWQWEVVGQVGSLQPTL